MDETALHELLSGRRHDRTAGLIRSGLFIASKFYSTAMTIRNFAYDRGLASVHKAAVPVISLGNITTGGTGKTPMAAYLGNLLTARGFRPGLLSRGYRSLKSDSAKDEPSSNEIPDAGNDEKRVLDRICEGVPHLQQRDRVQSAKRAVEEFGCNVLILDDGFQHRRLHRDLDLVLIDGLKPWGYDHVLPRGLLREKLAGLKRADLVLVTRIDLCDEQQRLAIRESLRQIRGNDECIEIAFVPRRFVNLNWEPLPLNTIARKRLFAFCGIGNPSGFLRTVESLNSKCEGSRTFADHHHYSTRDLSNLATEARDHSADFVVTTQKDLVKIAPTEWTGPPLLAIDIGVEFHRGVELLESKLRQILEPSSKQAG